MDTLNRWFERDKQKAHFLVVYIAEAHPTDGWQVPQNRRDNVLIAAHKALEDRKSAALALRDELGLKLPTFVDGMDDAASRAYMGWPDRIYVLDKDNVVRYRGAPGPRGFKPSEAMEALEAVGH